MSGHTVTHISKNKIEKILHDMLQSGTIHPNTSTFSSLVLLANKKKKEKDGSWRFCVDDRTLNNITIKD